MVGVTATANKLLMDAQRRKTLLLIEMYQRTQGRAPLWSEIRELTGARNSRDFTYLMLGLRKKGLVEFGDNLERSTCVTPAGLKAAIGQAKKP